jgi:hypothetical protein
VTASFEPLRDAERGWITNQLQVLDGLMQAYSPGDAGKPLNAAALDRLFATWLPQAGQDADLINAVINGVGIGFGSLLVDAGFDWVIATDEYGTDLAVLALPGTADVLVYPANFVAKRFERRETGFMVRAYDEMVGKVRHLSGSATKRPFWKRGG